MMKQLRTSPAGLSMFTRQAVVASSLIAAVAAGCAEVDVIEGEASAVAPPTAVLKSTPAAIMRFKSATFTFEAEGAASFSCKIDAGTAFDCASPYTTADLADGSHVFSVAARDAEGNEQAVPSTYQWVIDSTVAGVIFSATPAAFTNAPSAVFHFSSDEEMTFTCKLNGGQPLAANAVSGQVATCSFPNLPDGEHEVVVTGANQIGSQSATYEWVIDRVIPIFTKGSELKQAAKYTLNYVVSEYAASSACSVSWMVGGSQQVQGVNCGLVAGNTSGVLAINRGGSFIACRTYTLTTNFFDRAGNQLAVNNRYSTTFTFENENGTSCPAQAPHNQEEM